MIIRDEHEADSAPRALRIGDRQIGPFHPVYVVAEMSANHHHDLSQAIRLIEAAKTAGADAIKLQTYTADTLTIDCRDERFRVEAPAWSGRVLHDLYEQAHTPWEWHAKLQQVARTVGLDFFSTPFDETAVDFLEHLDVPLYKIASPEVVDLPLIDYVARRGRPLIISTGMASADEIEQAVTTARNAGARELALLKCTSSYPAPAADMHLRTLQDLSERFAVPVGLSDHTLGIAVPVAAVALGACIIEKHFTLSRATPGPDSTFSLEPDEFAQMVAAIRTAEAALGSVSYGPSASEGPMLQLRRSLFVTEDMKAGDFFTKDVVRSIRPGHGLAPKHLPEVLGRRASLDIKRGTPLEWRLVE